MSGINVKLNFTNSEEIKALVVRTENAVKELKNCLWELSKAKIDIEVGDENK